MVCSVLATREGCIGDVATRRHGLSRVVVNHVGVGARRLKLNATTFRGFTSHEHVDNLQLIHMNGRLFDYHLGRFYQVDPVVQFPTNSMRQAAQVGIGGNGAESMSSGGSGGLKNLSASAESKGAQSNHAPVLGTTDTVTVRPDQNWVSAQDVTPNIYSAELGQYRRDVEQAIANGAARSLLQWAGGPLSV